MGISIYSHGYVNIWSNSTYQCHVLSAIQRYLEGPWLRYGVYAHRVLDFNFLSPQTAHSLSRTSKQERFIHSARKS